MKRMKTRSLLVGLLLLTLLGLTSCGKVEEMEFVWPKPFSKINTGLQEGIAYDIALDGMTGAAMYNGEIYVCNKFTNNVTCYEKDFTPKRTIGKVGSRDGALLSPEGLWVDDDGVHVLDWGNRRIVRFAHDGTFIANYPITGTYSHLIRIGGLCRTDDRYWVSLSDNFLCHLLIVPEKGENKLLDAEGIGDFFTKDGVAYLFTQMGTAKYGRNNSLRSLKSGALYQCNDQELVKVCDLHPGIDPTPFVCLGDWYLSIGRTPAAVCVYSQETHELLGYAMDLSDVGKVDMLKTPLREIRLLTDDDTLYFLWPADHKVYTWTRSAT